MDTGSLLVYALILCTLCRGRENLRVERDADPKAVYLSGFSAYRGLQRSLNALPPNSILADNMLNEDLAGALPVPQRVPQLAPFASYGIPNYSNYPEQIVRPPDWNRLVEESLAKTFDVNSPAMTKIIEKIEVAVKHAASTTTSTAASSIKTTEDTPASTQAAPTSTTSFDIEKKVKEILVSMLSNNSTFIKKIYEKFTTESDVEVTTIHTANNRDIYRHSGETILDDFDENIMANMKKKSESLFRDFEKRLLNLLDANVNEKDDDSKSIDLLELQPKLVKKTVNSKGIGAVVSLDGSDNDVERLMHFTSIFIFIKRINKLLYSIKIHTII
uniref:SXP/RAL-2 family protein Ani s 5-like cation-binding domain-containing protein n=1 Tax=Ascaris lumbricoides TaxID=6252 RepID=A0A0M3INY3_ASCLU